MKICGEVQLAWKTIPRKGNMDSRYALALDANESVHHITNLGASETLLVSKPRTTLLANGTKCEIFCGGRTPFNFGEDMENETKPKCSMCKSDNYTLDENGRCWQCNTLLRDGGSEG